MRAYAKINRYGSESSRGFANTWAALVFESKQARDKFLAGTRNITAGPIKRTEVAKYATNWSLSDNREIKPRPFTDECWVIDDLYYGDIDGCLGSVEVGSIYDPLEKFHKHS